MLTDFFVSLPGVIKVLNALDSETNSQYFITLKVIDMNNDIELDPIREKFTLADVTVNVLVNKAIYMFPSSKYWV